MGLSLEAFDDREGYCRKLGHYVRFAYCRELGRGSDRPAAAAGVGDSEATLRAPLRRGRRAALPRREVAALPCGRIADCWFERLPVDTYLKANFSAEELSCVLAPPRPKLQSILEIVARLQAQGRPQPRG